MSLPFGVLVSPTPSAHNNRRSQVSCTWSIEQQQYLLSRPTTSDSGSMLTSLRHKLSKNRSSGRTSSAKDAMNVQAQSVAPATRRPAPSAPRSNDPPPAYTPAPATTTSPAQAAPTSNTTPATQADDNYAFLSTFDTVIVIDDSGSMAGSLWTEACNALATITPLCTAHDADGIDIHFLNHPTSYTNITSPGVVHEIFTSVRPGGGTPTGQRLNKILRQYLRAYEAKPEATKPINLICITDGAPSDDVESPLISAAKKLDKLDAPAWQVGVQFFQVGSDEQAQKHLKQLDDELADIAGDDELRDMVDTVPFTKGGAELSGEGILKVVLGAVTRRLDRKSKELHR